MEERLIDKENERLIRIKKRADEVDNEDAALEEKEEEQGEEEEVLVTLPEGDEEYDEDLVGLTPAQLAREKARRQKAEEEARAECRKLVTAAEEELEKNAFEKAETLFAQAACYEFAEADVFKGLWAARTKKFTDTAPFYTEEYAEDISCYESEVKEFLREKAGERLKEEREDFIKEEAELAPQVLEKQETRRQAFKNNRKYYAVRLFICLGVLAAFIVAVCVSASYIVRTLSTLPVILTGVFGGLALAAFIATLVFLIKLSGANKLCRLNEKLSSTEDGARLLQLRENLECLKLILEDEEE